jgi:hypothetical protein
VQAPDGVHLLESADLSAIATVALYLAFFDHSPRTVTMHYNDGCGVCTRVVDRLCLDSFAPATISSPAAATGSPPGSAWTLAKSRSNPRHRVAPRGWQSDRGTDMIARWQSKRIS